MNSVNAWNLINSMKSVSKWEDTIQANINGAVKNSYKEADIYFGGNTTSSSRTPTSTAAGTQTGEQTVTVSHSELKWKHGELISTKQESDFGIDGDGFFMLTEQKPGSVTPQKIFYTRDGQFHQEADAAGNITYRTTGGLYVVSRNDANAMGLGVSAAPVGTSPFSQDYFALSIPDTLSDMTYSKFGSTIYENNQTQNTVGLAGTTRFGTIKNTYLEGSNVDLNKQIASMSINKNYFDALTKQLLVFYANIDVALNLIK